MAERESSGEGGEKERGMWERREGKGEKKGTTEGGRGRKLSIPREKEEQMGDIIRRDIGMM